METTSQPQIFDSLGIEIHLDDFAGSLKTSGIRDKLVNMAESALASVQGIWRPRAVVRWFDVLDVSAEEAVLSGLPGGQQVRLALGFAARFLVEARQVLISIYTAGDELEKVAAEANRKRRVMDSYLYDMIGLAVLAKTGKYVQQIAEDKARARRWKVGPYLSPGSVHGWEISDQQKLCDLLPYGEIEVHVEGNGILRPFKTIVCMIGIGPGYTNETVGGTCSVCSAKDTCLMQNS